MKHLAAALFGLVLVSAVARASDYDLYIYDGSRSAVYASSEYAGIASEEVTYQATVAESVIVAVEEDPGDPDVLQLGFLLEIWVDGTLVTEDQDFGDVDYLTDLPAGSTIEAYMWPISEWTVSTVDFGNDSGDGTLDGFTITIKVNGVAVFNEAENGEVDYVFEVVEGDDIDVNLTSVEDDYDIELYDGAGDLVEYSDCSPANEPDWILADVGGTSSGGREPAKPTTRWEVSVLDYGDDSADGYWDGFTITIKINGTTVLDESEYGDVDYLIDVSDGDQIDVTMESILDDYDLELRDEGGALVEYSDLSPTVGPEDWIRGEVGGTFTSAGHTVVDDDDVVVVCGAVKGGGSPLRGILPGLVVLLGALLGLSRLVRRGVRVRA